VSSRVAVTAPDSAADLHDRTTCTTDLYDPMEEQDMDIKVLGPGCRNCVTLEARTREALEALGKDATIEKVTDTAEIMGYGIMSTPGLVVDGTVVVSGRVPSVKQLAGMLEG
jgi:small redox-active disulfide protein 2